MAAAAEHWGAYEVLVVETLLTRDYTSEADSAIAAGHQEDIETEAGGCATLPSSFVLLSVQALVLASACTRLLTL